MNRIALITGGSRGIGYGIAEKLAAEKWDLIINGIREEHAVAGSLAKLRATGVRVGYARGDVGSSEGRSAIVKTTRALVALWLKEQPAPGSASTADSRPPSEHSINLLVNNAGVAPKIRADLLEMTEESYDHVMETNLKGAFFLTQTFSRDMVKMKKADPAFHGSIVNITSISATVVSINRGEYCIAKAGLSMMSQLFSVRLGGVGIPVYEIRPGVIKTDLTACVAEKYDKLIAGGLNIQPRWGAPEDVGKAVAALARGDFPYSVGQVIMVDGGLTVPRL